MAREWLLEEAQAFPPASHKFGESAIRAAQSLPKRYSRLDPKIRWSNSPASKASLRKLGFFPNIASKPILFVAGQGEERRRCDDAAILAAQLEKAGALVSLHVIEAGHGLAPDNKEMTLALEWLGSLEAFARQIEGWRVKLRT